MASKAFPPKNAAHVFRCVLFAQSDNQIKSNPTIAAGDWKVSIDGGAFANLATLPDVDPDSSVQVKVSLSADEMNGDEIMVTAIDASGAEWHSVAWVIPTVAVGYDSLSTLTAAQLWAYGTRTLTTAAVVGPGAEIDGDDITAWRGDSMSVSFSDLGNVTARTALWFTAKRRASQADSEAMIMITEDDDLLYINGAAAETAANGTLTVTDAAAGDMTLALAAEETAKMPAGAVLVWDIQMLTASGVSTLAAGTITFTADVTRATE